MYSHRVCLNCNSTTTYIRKGYPGHPKDSEHWIRYKDGFICMKCHHKLIYNPSENKKSWNRRKITFGRIQILLPENPRKGICEWCGKKIGDTYINWLGKEAVVKRTQIHHIQYHQEDPLKDTVELCHSCHTKESHRLRKEHQK